ncbi:MAG: ATPase domain-containing protein, partial [Pseudomonadota bacterium]
MKKQNKFIFVCQSCGYQTPKWMGRCPDCGQWNSFVEEAEGSGGEGVQDLAMGQPQPVNAISLDSSQRVQTGIREFDRTLGGGLVPGSLILIGGEPGIGKSTLLLQVAGRLSEEGVKVLYVSGEESPQQIKMRAD